MIFCTGIFPFILGKITSFYNLSSDPTRDVTTAIM